MVADSHNIILATGDLTKSTFGEGIAAGAQYPQVVIDTLLPGCDLIFVAIAMFLFAIATQLAF